MKPSVGRIVHVRGRSIAGNGGTFGECKAAIITEVKKDNVIRVTLFDHAETGVGIICCPDEFRGNDGHYYGHSWHWPEKEDES